MIHAVLRLRRGPARIAAALAAGVLLLSAAAWGLSTLTAPAHLAGGLAGRSTPAGPAAEGRPHAIEPTVRLPGLIDEASVRQAVGRLAPDRLGSVSYALHVLRLFGPAAECRGERGRTVVLEALLDNDQSLASFGMPTLVDTRYGVRCRTVEPRNARYQLWREAHPNQLLAVLSEVGVPLSRPLSTPGGRRAVRHLLEDALANFELGDTQLEWSALSFALYLPPQDSWQDKYGVRYTFDGLAQELMGRPFRPESPCAGTHQLYTLTALLRVDAEAPVLSPPVREQLREYLRQTAERAVRAQAPDGNWDVRWYEESGRPAAPQKPEAGADVGAVLATGHHMEWLMRLPPEMVPPEDCLARAARWLHVRLLADPASALAENYCPYSHAGRVLGDLVVPPAVRPGGQEEQTPASREAAPVGGN
jgi:hypothetical protein